MAHHVKPFPLEPVPLQIIINADGSRNPPTGVEIEPGGQVQFVINFPAGKNHCTIPFGQVTFRAVVDPMSPGGTIKVGS
jgi:hypothetical protein